jgi:chorismate mutase
MSADSNDPVISHLRHQISDNDRALVGLVCKRLELVATIKSYKERHGIDFLDAQREQWMLRDLHRANRGPLSTDGLDELFADLLALTKREVDRMEVAEVGQRA